MNNEQPTFKAGDEVYCPARSTEIYVLEPVHVQSFGVDFSSQISGLSPFTRDGKIYKKYKNQSIFHATPENKVLLEALYKCDFESPKLKGSDLTRKLLSEGKHVLCYVGFESDAAAIKGRIIRLIESSKGDLFYQSATGGNAYPHAVPCNDYANLVDGVLTLKSENEK